MESKDRRRQQWRTDRTESQKTWAWGSAAWPWPSHFKEDSAFSFEGTNESPAYSGTHRDLRSECLVNGRLSSLDHHYGATERDKGIKGDTVLGRLLQLPFYPISPACAKCAPSLITRHTQSGKMHHGGWLTNNEQSLPLHLRECEDSSHQVN